MKTLQNNLKTYIGLNEDGVISPLFDLETQDLINDTFYRYEDYLNESEKSFIVSLKEQCTTITDFMSIIALAESKGYHQLVNQWTNELEKILKSIRNENI
jgi:hypothetical protein